MINTVIGSRAFTMPAGIVPEELRVSPAQNQRFEVLSQTPLTDVFNGAFDWQVAQIRALFHAVYAQGVVTEQDAAKLKSLAKELKAEKKQLKTLGLSQAKVSEAKACLKEADTLLKETYALVKGLTQYEKSAKSFDEVSGAVADATNSPLYAGESLDVADAMKKSLAELVKLQEVKDRYEENTPVFIRLDENWTKDRDELALILEDWGDQLIDDIQQELWQANSQLEEQRLQNALAHKCDELNRALKKMGFAYREHEGLEDIRKQLEKLATKVRKMIPKEQAAVVPLKWGSEEWEQLRQKRPAVQQSQVTKLIGRLIDPSQWSEEVRDVVHAAVVGMQLSQTAIQIAAQMTQMKKMQEVEEETALLGLKLAHGESPFLPEESLSHDEKLAVLDAYRLSRLTNTPFKEIWAAMNEEVDQPLLDWVPSKIAAIGRCLPTNQDYLGLIAQECAGSIVAIQQASLTLALCQQDSFKIESSQKQNEIRHYAKLLHDELLKSVEKAPPTTCSLFDLAIWKQKVEDQCYAVRTLEEQIAKLMEPLRILTQGADLDRFGNKHKNIILQARLAEALEIPDLVVPVPRGVPTEQIEAFLRKHAPEVFQHWQELADLFARYEGESFLEDPESVSILDYIDYLIRTAFAKAAQDEAHFQKLVPKEVIDWLHTLSENGDYLMVRSTGAEDSRQLANAGGNLSRAYVLPERASFATALGDVVRSYFSASSLQNRLNAKKDPFSQELKLAVTAQQLIGEPLGGFKNPADIPISLVLFTSEPLYVGGEKFRVMRLSATFGHGEGVVGNQGIASDTALLLISEAHPDQLYVLYDNQTKPTRLAPVATEQGIKLDKVKNPEELRDQRVLTPELLARLYHWGIVGEKFFDDFPTDMEIVVKKGIIYPVQARPVNRPDLLPTYLDLKKAAALPNNPIQEKLQGEMVVPGAGSVVTLHSPQEIHYAATLEEAQNTFIGGKHKLVVISRPEPANSHPIVNFSSLGIPCLLITDLQAVEKIRQKASQTTPVIACVQTATLNLWNSPTPPEEMISKGFAVHPAKIAISLDTEVKRAVHIPKEVPQQVKDLVLAIRSATTKKAAQLALQELRSQAWVRDIKLRKKELAAHLKEMSFVPKQVKKGYKVLRALDAKIDRAFEELNQVLQSEDNDRLRPLFHAKVLENLLFSPGSSPSSFSLVDVEPLHKEAMAIIAYQKQLDHKAHFASELFAGTKTFNPAFEEKWQNFLLKLEAYAEAGTLTPQQIKQFKQQMQTLETAGLLTAVMSFFFPTITSDSLAAFQNFLGLLPPKDEKTIRRMLEINFSLKEMRAQLDRFADKQAFEQAFTDLQNEAKTLMSAAIKEVYQTASPFMRYFILQNMGDLVDVFDTAIKTMKASPEYTSYEKVEFFKRMLGPYADLFYDWIENVVDQKQIPLHGNWPIRKYLSEMKIAFRYADEKLYPSPEFSVSSAVLGALTAFERHQPQTLEDYFTLIHQNLVAGVARESQKLLNSKTIALASVPEDLKKYMSYISADLKYSVQQTGVHFTDEEITIHYNVPLRNHSAKLRLIYDKKTQTTRLTAYMLGIARNRWNAVISLAEWLNEMSLLPLTSSPSLGEQEAIVSWQIHSQDALTRSMEEFKTYCDMSMQEPLDFEKAFADLLERWSSSIDQRISKIDDELMRTITRGIIYGNRTIYITLLDKIMQNIKNVEVVDEEIIKQERILASFLTNMRIMNIIFYNNHYICYDIIELSIWTRINWEEMSEWLWSIASLPRSKIDIENVVNFYIIAIKEGLPLPYHYLSYFLKNYDINRYTDRQLLELCGALIRSDKLKEEASLLLINKLTSSYFYDREESLKVILKLIGEGYEILNLPPNLQHIVSLLKDADPSVQQEGKSLLQKLKEQGDLSD